LGSWELFRKGHGGLLEFRKINDFSRKSKNSIVLKRKKNEIHDFLIYKSADVHSSPVKARFEVKGNKITVYFDNSYEDFTLTIEKNDDKVLKIIDINNRLGLL
jgi:hypothetical protein